MRIRPEQLKSEIATELRRLCDEFKVSPEEWNYYWTCPNENDATISIYIQTRLLPKPETWNLDINNWHEKLKQEFEALKKKEDQRRAKNGDRELKQVGDLWRCSRCGWNRQVVQVGSVARADVEDAVRHEFTVHDCQNSN